MSICICSKLKYFFKISEQKETLFYIKQIMKQWKQKLQLSLKKIQLHPIPSLNLESDNGWEDYLVEREDGILSPVSTDIAERAQSSLQCASTGLPVETSVMISKKRKVEAFLEATTPLSSSINRSSKSQKNDVCLNNFMSKCTDIGSNITSLLNENLEKDKKENVSTEDYHFMLSMVESMKKIKSEKEKLILKSQFLVQIAEVIEKENVGNFNGD